MSRVRIAHLSDPHFGTLLEGSEDGLVRSLHDLKPSLILLTGDITQRARRSQFRAAKAFTERLNGTRIIAVPGNHDIPLFNIFARLFWPYRGFQKLFKDRTEKDVFHQGVQVIGLNSTSRWRHVQGDFNIPRIEKRFRAPHPEAKVRIAAFHHPMDCAKHVDDKNLLRGREAAYRVFERAQVDLVVGGHIHDPFVNLSNDRFPNGRRTMVFAVAGTCLSWRTRAGAPNSFNLIDIETSGDPHIILTRYDRDGDFNFKPIRASHFRRGPDGNWNRANAEDLTL